MKATLPMSSSETYPGSVVALVICDKEVMGS